jgi:hypothetical protein
MTLGIGALITYVFFRGWIMCETYTKKDGNSHLVVEFIYSMFMIYLLNKGSYLFLAIIHFYFFTMLALSLLAIIFLTPPETDIFFDKSQVKFWVNITVSLIFQIAVWVLCVNY